MKNKKIAYYVTAYYADGHEPILFGGIRAVDAVDALRLVAVQFGESLLGNYSYLQAEKLNH